MMSTASDTELDSGDAVLSGLSGLLVCNHLNNEQLRMLSECSKQLNSLSIGSIRALAPKKLPVEGSLRNKCGFTASRSPQAFERTPE